jgi:hypothetical protein
MLRIWIMIWINDNHWMENKTQVTSWHEIPYLPKGKDTNCRSQIGTKDRAELVVGGY